MFVSRNLPVPLKEVRFSEHLDLLLKSVHLFSGTGYTMKVNRFGEAPMNDIDIEQDKNGAVFITYVPHGKSVRERMKPGRFFRNFFVEEAYKYVADEYTEWFANYLHASFAPATVEEVSGEAIRHWYLHENHRKGGGNLQVSCMQYANCAPYLKLQVKSPNIALLIVRSTQEPDKLSAFADVYRNVKVVGREEPQTFVDRPYYTFEYEKMIFQEYARKNGYYCWANERQAYTPEGVLTTMPQMSLETLLPLLKQYPYLDTFAYMSWNGSILRNTQPKLRYKFLHSTSGCAYKETCRRYGRTMEGNRCNWIWKTKKTSNRVRKGITK